MYSLHPSDTKSKRPESFQVPEPLVHYVKRYLEEMRPRLLASRTHDGFLASYQRRPLTGGRLYSIARARIRDKFGKNMCLHDFRRSAATYLAMDAPEMMGLIPGVLQHSSPDVGAKHYNLSRAISASQRFAAHLAQARSKLRAPTKKRGP